MATVKDLMTGIEEDLRVELKHAHVRTQLLQFAWLFAAALATAVATGGVHHAGWGALAGLVVGAAGAAVRQMRPQVPWSAVLSVLHATAPAGEPTAAPPAAPPHG